ncbi:LexA family transcriptional regulator [Escherichia coli]|uniref:LexA family transcriptional regulator n=1 Tax=Escherichia coli TaxID=562 RepID=UPI000774F328|nr:helix-turn-helix transcriptional regulator [Escherichia coli]EEW8806255.1 helix-turn-helix transcriptional regulator [Escherichia coli]EFC4783578.1 helix-turn-helix transcriptional regulator [Escherichia coli]EFC6841868.1 helix-turn-helix transcriptional regulator [Escherichia coli]EFC6932880.1 helix-turn-helix transcriptional regulator [Escherichia coli]EFD0481643.1 helix-turn-helix transcriptional regulator [Escherichia coli]
MTFSERLNMAMRNAGYSQGRLAKEVGMAQSSVNQLLNKANGSRKTVEIAKALGVNPEWLASGVGPMEIKTSTDSHHVHNISEGCISNSYVVDVLDIRYSCGPGSYNSDFPDIVRSIAIEPGYASRIFGGRPASTIKAINAHGDSMKDTINPEDLVFVDISVHTFNGDGIYAFTYSGTSHIKRLQRVKDTLTVISDNPAYKDWAIEQADFEQLHIDGKVIVSWPMTLHRFA